MDELAELDTAEYRLRANRLKNRGQIEHSLAQVFQTHKESFWLEKLRATRIPCAPVNDLTEVFQDPRVRARNFGF